MKSFRRNSFPADVKFGLIFAVFGIPASAPAGVTYVCDQGVYMRRPELCAYLNSTIASLYKNALGNVNAEIVIRYDAVSLGESFFNLNLVTYSSYLAALTTAAQNSGNPVQLAAVDSLNAFDTAVYGNSYVALTSPLARALGLPAKAGTDQYLNSCLSPDTPPCFDGVISITADPDTPLYYRDGTPEPPDAYDFFSVVEHETDEILGTASCVSTTGTTLSNVCGDSALAAVDLFRYLARGKPVLIGTTPGAYFSYDGGRTNDANGKIYNTLANGEDYADFVSSIPCQAQQSIQDAEGCPGFDAGLDISNDGGAEINILNAIGYPLATQVVPVTPAITNVQNAAGLPGYAASGSYVTIYGYSLSTNTQGRTWAASDFIANADGTLNMPLSLDGTSVTVEGIPAYVEYVSASQVNIVTAARLPVMTEAPIVVTVDGQASVPYYSSAGGVAPIFFTWYPGTADNGKYIVAQHLNGTDVGKAGLFPTAPDLTTPAKPGETVILYGTGFGATNPPIAPGIETDQSQVYRIAAPMTALIGDNPFLFTPIVFAGLAPNLSQVYQLNITIPPNAPNGDLPFVVMTQGLDTLPGLITVQGP